MVVEKGRIGQPIYEGTNQLSDGLVALFGMEGKEANAVLSPFSAFSGAKVLKIVLHLLDPAKCRWHGSLPYWLEKASLLMLEKLPIEQFDGIRLGRS